MISPVNRVTCITRRTATAIDHMFSNTVINNEIHIGIIKTQISGNVSIFSNITNRLRQEYKIE